MVSSFRRDTQQPGGRHCEGEVRRRTLYGDPLSLGRTSWHHRLKASCSNCLHRELLSNELNLVRN